jgi:hypothetical protein
MPRRNLRESALSRLRVCFPTRYKAMIKNMLADLDPPLTAVAASKPPDVYKSEKMATPQESFFVPAVKDSLT